MTDPVLAAQFDALEAQIELLKVQVQALRHRVTTTEEPEDRVIRQELPARCEQIEAARCGLQDEDARTSLASFREPQKWRCIGCREVFPDGVNASTT